MKFMARMKPKNLLSNSLRTPMNAHQQTLDKWFKEKGWGYWSPLSILARLMEETGELAREINHRFGPKKKKSSEKDGERF